MTRKQALFFKAIGVRLNQKFTCDYTENKGVYVIREDKDNFLQVYNVEENGEERKFDTSLYLYIFLHHDLHLVDDILDNEEKKYLEAICKPFKDRIKNIRLMDFVSPEVLNLKITLDTECIVLPEFKLGEMYGGMNVGETYTLKELGLFTEPKEDKEKPKMVNYEGDGYADGKMVYDIAYCPNCEHRFDLDYDEKSEYCPHCGQKLQWEDDKVVEDTEVEENVK